MKSMRLENRIRSSIMDAMNARTEPVALLAGGSRGPGRPTVRELGHQGLIAVCGVRGRPRGTTAAGRWDREGRRPAAE